MNLLPIPVNLQVRLLKAIAPPIPKPMSTVYDCGSKLEILLGNELLTSIRDKVVIDFGCGYGLQTIELVKAGAKLVIGIDINPDCLKSAAEAARKAGVADRCRFRADPPPEEADLVLSLDSFEHFEDPYTILSSIRQLLKPGAALLCSWGPPWYHPRGMHLNELPPWTHVFFAEEAVVRWRQLMRGGTATTYKEIGLNQMTIARFEKLVKSSGLKVEMLRVIPIKPLRLVHNRLTREFTTSIVQSKLIRS